MNVLAIDTATALTSVALLGGAGELEAADTPPPGSRGRHAETVLALARLLLERAACDWRELDLVAAGTGPGGYTGLRIGLATARGVARAAGAPLAGVGTLRALAAPLRGQTALALIDARRGELFAAAYRDDVEVLAPSVIAPAQLAGLLPAGATAIGDAALAHREQLERAGHSVAPTDSPLHRVSALAICRIAAAGEGGPPAPLYLRRPDAELNLERGPG
ncbi:MAG TPA: tRNA (adenosine(37)-N6)-threonylcarbamoyltransferase complex dimerization subunit type 1 TsaB [Solirubrobacteraceae bacterium]|nr:tRNA (adenosine(37)-N6)-threonylcarbamoyltransferase complex dimerization subunit type 1 TsaB [Solirubrobacteraceae bacterium]